MPFLFSLQASKVYLCVFLSFDIFVYLLDFLRMGRKSVAPKTIRAFSAPGLGLYNRTNQEWALCLDFQGIPGLIGDQWYFTIESVFIGDIGLEFLPSLPLTVDIVPCVDEGRLG